MLIIVVVTLGVTLGIWGAALAQDVTPIRVGSHHFAPLAGRARCFFEAASLEALT